MTKDAWYCRLSDGSCCWENLPSELHSKLSQRSKSLPIVKSVTLLNQKDWVLVFNDGSVALRGSSIPQKLKQELQDSDSDSQIKLLVFAPGGGWFLIRQDGTKYWDKLPTSLDHLLRLRSIHDPPIDTLAISMTGGWFIRFLDGECEWEGLPPPLEKLLIQLVRKGDPKMTLALSLEDPRHYFLSMGDTVSWLHDGAHLKNMLNWLNGDEDMLNENVYMSSNPLPSPVEITDFT